MPTTRAALTAILGPTNTGKTHLAVERLCAHSSGMMGFPLRLLAREIYDRVVAIKGPKEVALITGEERIEPAGARWYLCTAESMPVSRDFAFVALDEAQLGADPERGHIFTDRMLHARGREETMILGSESLRPMVRKLLPDAEIVSRPRFSTLSYAGAKKLSRLPPRSAIVAFSVEQVYAAAELLRRLRGGAAVVMGALSPRTRNAQVEMFQSGEVDYLVATDAIGMGLNLDVGHIAFAGLTKFDGNRTRRLTAAEMAQIAGRAGRHQRDGTFGTLSGESSDMAPEEVLAIEEHRFPELDWLYWRESRPCFDTLSTLINDLEARPDGPPLRAAPEAIDLAVLKRLSDMADVRASLSGPESVERLWEVASLPDFRKMGAEQHSRFVASLWPHLGSGQPLPHAYFAGEVSKLDSIQGDIETLSGRIAAARTWSYIAQRDDWVSEPYAMAERTRMLEEKLSDALHHALRQRFVDKRTSMLLRKGLKDASLVAVTVDAQKNVLVDDEFLGTLDGFVFKVDPAARVGERKLLLAAAEHYLAAHFRIKARALAMADHNEFSMAKDNDGKPALFWNGELLGHLVKGRTFMQPQFRPLRAVADIEGDALRAVLEKAEEWIAAQLAKHLGGVVALNELATNAETEGSVRALAARLADLGGLSSRHYLFDAVHALTTETRAAARKAGISFGALDVFHYAVLRPGAARWRTALFAALYDKPMPELPPESAGHLKEWKFATSADCRNAGYRKVGEEYLRIDLVERIVKKAHEERCQKSFFAMDSALSTSFGMSEEALTSLMNTAGFRKVSKEIFEQTMAETPAAAEITVLDADSVVGETEAADDSAPESVSAADDAGESVSDGEATGEGVEPAKHIPDLPPTYWRWVGIRKMNQRMAASESKPKRFKAKGQNQPRPEKAPEKPIVAPAPPSDFAMQLAALKEKMGS
jgi:ATP-dependent RNA helicase SUPV3L1/SUV3